ncbi:Peptidyl-prolyl cis-trans isomerase [Melia azedarach]|uniref:Peptidyl-prolyl cis-trans isomerase n=1 Tax=Melia azedarach TaxID=155640 RepID=A0ACC1Z423_MELAZ|nr:Peptidyl-prolyl cis-trans isomerase [Melia azedarach]
MERRIRYLHRQPLARSEPFLRYLKPGALARMRDSRISARSHRVCAIPQISPHRPPSPSPPPSSDGQPQVNMNDGFPCFSGRMYGPRCPQRKKLVAAKAVLFLSSSQSGPVSDLPDPVIDVFNSDSNMVVAH